MQSGKWLRNSNQMAPWRIFLHGAMALAVVILATGCGGETGKPAEPAQTVKPVSAASAPAANPAPEAALTAESLPGTAWSAGPLTLAFGQDGKLTANGSESGEWTFDAGQITVKTGDMSYIVTVRGGKLFYGDMELSRTN